MIITTQGVVPASHEPADPVWGAADAARSQDAASGVRHAASTAGPDRPLDTELTA